MSELPTPTTETPTTRPAPADRRHRSIRIAVTAVVLFLMICGAGAMIIFAMTENRTAQRTFTDSVNQVRVRTDTGNIEIRAGVAGQPTTVVTHTKSAFGTPSAESTLTDGVLQVTGGCESDLPFADICSVDLEITVAPGASVQATTHTGDVTVEGLTAGATAATNTGNVEVKRVGGNLQLTTDTGNVLGELINGGTVTAQSDTGNVDLAFAKSPDRVQASTATGDATVEVPHGTAYRIEAITENGKRAIDAPNEPTSARSIHAQTETGNVTVRAAG